MSYLGKEVSTEYSSDSQYVSSEEHYTPFPSLTMSKKMELEKYIHNGEVTYNISTFSEPDVIEPGQKEEQQQQDVSKQNPIIGCCLLL